MAVARVITPKKLQTIARMRRAIVIDRRDELNEAVSSSNLLERYGEGYIPRPMARLPRYFARSHYTRLLCDLVLEQAEMGCYLLVLKHEEVARLFGCSKRTAYAAAREAEAQLLLTKTPCFMRLAEGAPQPAKASRTLRHREEAHVYRLGPRILHALERREERPQAQQARDWARRAAARRRAAAEREKRTRDMRELRVELDRLRLRFVQPLRSLPEELTEEASEEASPVAARARVGAAPEGKERPSAAAAFPLPSFTAPSQPEPREAPSAPPRAQEAFAMTTQRALNFAPTRNERPAAASSDPAEGSDTGTGNTLSQLLERVTRKVATGELRSGPVSGEALPFRPRAAPRWPDRPHAAPCSCERCQAWGRVIARCSLDQVEEAWVAECARRGWR